MSVERRTLLRMLGAELVLTPGAEGMPGAIRKAEQLLKKPKTLHAAAIQQPRQPEIHATTAVEIWEDTNAAWTPWCRVGPAHDHWCRRGDKIEEAGLQGGGGRARRLAGY